MIHAKHIGMGSDERKAVFASRIRTSIGQSSGQVPGRNVFHQQLNVDLVRLFRFLQRHLHLLARVLVGNRSLHCQRLKVRGIAFAQLRQTRANVGFGIVRLPVNCHFADHEFHDMQRDFVADFLRGQGHA